MAFDKYLEEKDAFIFELDNVLYPEKDYLLQVYYLYSQFIEYGEQINAAEILRYMETTFLEYGADGLYEKTSKQFSIPEKYRVNFELLLNNARLPLKLLIFEEVLKILQSIVLERKQIFIFTDGNPLMQLNKIKQMEWHGLEQYLRVYFSAETAEKPSAKGLDLMVNSHDLDRKRVLMIGKSKVDEAFAKEGMVDYLNIDKLLLT